MNVQKVLALYIIVIISIIMLPIHDTLLSELIFIIHSRSALCLYWAAAGNQRAMLSEAYLCP